MYCSQTYAAWVLGHLSGSVWPEDPMNSNLWLHGPKTTPYFRVPDNSYSSASLQQILCPKPQVWTSERHSLNLGEAQVHNVLWRLFKTRVKTLPCPTNCPENGQLPGYTFRQVPVAWRAIQYSYLRHGPQCHPIHCKAALALLISIRCYTEKSVGSVCRILEAENTSWEKELLCNKEPVPSPKEKRDGYDSKHSQKGKASKVELLWDYRFLV